MVVSVSVGAMGDLRARAESLLRGPVGSADLALAFDESVASTVDVQVGGRNFFPPMLEDIAPASSSIHINQFGFRPGAIGEQFATALLAKASEGVTVRLVVDGQGSRPDGSGREFYGRLLGRRRGRPRRAGHAAMGAAPTGGGGRPEDLGPRPARPLRPPEVRRRGRPHRVGRRRRCRGPLRRRTLPRPLRQGDRPGRLPAAARLRRQLQMAGRRDPDRRAGRALPRARGGRRLGPGDGVAQRAGQLPARSPTPSRGYSTTPARRSTW